MKIAVAQIDIAFCEREKNFSKAEKMIVQAAQQGADTVVLPEMWSTGFFPKDDIGEYADENGHLTKEFLSKLAEENKINIVAGSVLTRRGEEYFNSAYVFDRSGSEIAHYDKIHLFSYMGEDDYFTPGDSLCTFELEGIRCGLIICYDLRFVEQVRSLALKGIDVLFLPAAWPDKRQAHWVTLSRARAIENQIYVVNVNCSGVIDGNLFAGYSSVIDPWGEYLVQTASEEALAVADLDMTVVHEIRNTINVYRDRRPELYQLD